MNEEPNTGIFWISQRDLQAMRDGPAGGISDSLGNPIGVQVTLRWRPELPDDVALAIYAKPFEYRL